MCKIEPNYSYCTVKLHPNSKFSLFSFNTDSKGNYSLNYNHFSKSWNEYVELLQKAIDECKPIEKQKNSSGFRRHVRYGGPEAMNAFYDSQRYSKLKKLEYAMLEEFDEKNNNLSNLISDILRSKFTIFESSTNVTDNLKNEIYARN